MRINIHTLGDSTLDNIFWVANKKDSVEGQLQSELGKEYKVVSHAYDGFTTNSLLQGDVVGRVLPAGSKKEEYLREKLGTSTELHINPITKLSEEISKKPDAKHYVVISVGGNDFRENLSTPWKLFTIIPDVQKKYLEILDKVQKLNPNVKPILMFQYRTDVKNDPYCIYSILGIAGRLVTGINTLALGVIAGSCVALIAFNASAHVAGALILLSAATLCLSQKIAPLRVTIDILSGKHPGIIMINSLMEKLYKSILERAKKDKIPVLDLPNSFNPHESLYICGIEPNKEGGKRIALGLSHIIKNYASGIFQCDGTVAEIDPNGWRVKYVTEPIKH